MANPDITIAICTYNRAEMLRNTLQSLSQLIAPESRTFEILVVDNDSTDDTAIACDRFSESHPEIEFRYVFEPCHGIAAARSCAVREMRGEWLAFIDDDEIADPRWLHRLVEMAEEKQTLCVVGAVHLSVSEHERPNLARSCREVFSDTSNDRIPHPIDASNGTSGNVLIHRQVFEQIGSFMTELTEGGEDNDFFRRMRKANIRAWYAPDAIIWHIVTPDRLTDERLLFDSYRAGWNFARRDHLEKGNVATSLLVVARLVKISVITIPQLLFVWLRNDRERLLGHRVDVSRNCGYFANVLSRMLPESIGKMLNLRPEFRRGRILGRAATTVSTPMVSQAP